MAGSTNSISYLAKGLAEKGIIPYSQSIPVKPAIYKGSMIQGSGTKAVDSPDVPVTNLTNVTESENSIFIDPNDVSRDSGRSPLRFQW